MTRTTMNYSDYEQHKIYQQLDFDINIELSTGEHQPTIIHEAYGTLSALAWVEQFVKASINSKSLPDFTQHNKDNRGATKRRSLTDYYALLNTMTGAYDERYFYSPRVEVFFQACKSLGLITQAFRFERNPLEQDFVTGQSYLDTYNALIERIRELCSKSKFKNKLKEHERSVRRRGAKAMMWEHKLFNWKSRHLLMPLTLEYKPEFRCRVTPELIQEHLQRLLTNRRCNGLLNGIKHYVWRIEEGDKVGLHIHILVAYDGQSHQDMAISRSICTYWETVITEGMGYARSSSMYKNTSKLRTFGAAAGQIDSHDHAKRQTLRGALRYLVKADQFLKKKKGRRFKTFGMSQPPEPSGMGRPRMKAKLAIVHCLAQKRLPSSDGRLRDDQQPMADAA